MYKPGMYCKNVFEIDYIKLKESGIKLLCFDLDNTLDKPDEITIEIEDRVIELLNKVESMEFQILIVSNNSLKKRVSSFSNQRNYDYIHKMKKPFQTKYKENEVLSSYNKEEIVFIGDKLITDVLGGNIYGSPTILVDPLYPKSKKWYSIVMSVIEYIFITMISFKKGEYYDKM